MLTWLSIAVLSALLGFSAASPRVLSSSRNSAVEEIDELLEELLKTHRSSAEDTRNLVPSSHASGSKELMGLAHLDNYIYVVQEHSSTIQVFDDESLSKTSEIAVSGLQYAGDIAACDTTDQLYVLDRYPANVVWKVDPKTQHASKLITFSADESNDQPITLSVRNGRVLLTSKFNPKLFLYNGDTGELIKEIRLSGDIVPRHAVETADGSFVVSHVAARGKKTRDGVSLYDENGQLLVMYGGQRGSGDGQFDRPTYIALKPDGDVLVADFENRRVVELNAELTSGQVVISRQSLESRQYGDDGNPSGRPWRMSVNEEKQELYIGIGTGVIQVYDL